MKRPTPESVTKEYNKGLNFNNQINLNETVRNNENFFIGKQWEGVESNGLPTPVFNFLQQVTQFIVASITSDNIIMNCSPLSKVNPGIETIAEIINKEFNALLEHNKIGVLIREYLTNSAVDGASCTYTYWDSEVETGQAAKGAIVTEIIENTRVFFGNPNDKRVEKQPYIIIESREIVDDVKRRAKENGSKDYDSIRPDSSNSNSQMDGYTDDKVTVLLRLWRDLKTGTIHSYECTQNATIKPEEDLDLSLYPITWLPWHKIPDCYHGEALITGLIPNQIFVNKLFALSQISLMTTAYPKIVYDKTRVKKWDNRVGAAIGINGGDVDKVAKILDPAAISPQISQFIDLAVNYTKTFLGATPAAMGETRPDNTSAIIALQRAAAIPSELTKQNLYQSVEDLGRIYMDFMANRYGQRIVEISIPDNVTQTPMPGLVDGGTIVTFDFSVLKEVPMQLKTDVGASAYWSEIASMQTLDNLLMMDKIDLIDYLERVPDGYLSKRQELIAKYKTLVAQPPQEMMGGAPPQDGIITAEQSEIPLGKGYGELQRTINETGAIPNHALR